MLPGLGKKRDSHNSRFNNLSHGLRSQFEVIPGENREEYETFRAEICDDMKPDGALEKSLVDSLVFFLWRLRRAARAEAAIINANQSIYDRQKIDWEGLLRSNLLDPILRYEVNSLRHISRIIEDLKKLKMGLKIENPDVGKVIENK